jgi:electron transfer flavoprotein beta subunit
MGFKIIVLAKQVPDTRNVGKDAMRADGTVNRGALSAIYNPEDLNALEQALLIKDKFKDTEITLLTMGPPRAADIIRESLYRGIDRGYLITDRRFAGADTLATSYVISKAILKCSPYDIILSGRQAIDGDTAQVGPQTAENLGIPQITYVEEIQDLDSKSIQVKRRLERGVEVVKAKLPVLITVHGSAEKCRPKNARLMMKYKYAKTKTELQAVNEDYLNSFKERPYLNIEELNLDDLQCDMERVGLTGSPTKVKAIENVVIKGKESKRLSSSNRDIKTLINALIESKVVG